MFNYWERKRQAEHILQLTNKVSQLLMDNNLLKSKIRALESVIKGREFSYRNDNSVDFRKYDYTEGKVISDTYLPITVAVKLLYDYLDIEPEQGQLHLIKKQNAKTNGKAKTK